MSRERQPKTAVPAAREAAAGRLTERSATDRSPAKTVQQSLGNRAMLRRIEAGLVIGGVHDSAEREADRAAEAVMSGRTPQLSGAFTAAPPVRRRCASCAAEEEEGVVRRKESNAPASSVAPAAVAETLRSPGRPLEAPTQRWMESRFGYDFSAVRVHSDDRAARSAAGIGALAYTAGRNIVFGAGHYAPYTIVGRSLLAHELAHVVQNSFGGSAPTIRRKEEDPLDAKFMAAVKAQDWQTAAELLNGMNREAILARTAKMDPTEFRQIHRGAAENPRVGPQSQAALLTAARLFRTPSRKRVTKVDAAIELTRRALMVALLPPVDKERALSHLAAVEKFLQPLVTPENIRKYYPEGGIFVTNVQLVANDAVGAVKTMQGQIRSGLGLGGLWDTYFDRLQAGRDFLNVLNGEAAPQQPSLIYQEVKEAAYGALIQGLKAARKATVAPLRAGVAKLPPNWRGTGDTVVDVLDFILDMFGALILAIIGLMVGFVEGIVTMLTGIVKLAIGIVKLVALAIQGLFDHFEAFKAEVNEIGEAVKRIPDGLRMIVKDWWKRYTAASPEMQVLMGGELIGEIEAFLVTFAFAGAKAGNIPKLTVPTQLEIKMVATTAGRTKAVVVVTEAKVIAGSAVAAPAVAGTLVSPALMSASLAGGGGGGGGGAPGGGGGGGAPGGGGGGGPAVRRNVGKDLVGHYGFQDPDPALQVHRHLVDQSGRPVMAEGPVNLAPGVRNPGAQSAVSGPFNTVEGRSYHAAHLIAREFGGSGEAFNLVPVPEGINLSEMGGFERRLADLLRDNQRLYLQAYPEYAAPGRAMPSRVIYRVYRWHDGWKLLEEVTVPIQAS